MKAIVKRVQRLVLQSGFVAAALIASVVPGAALATTTLSVETIDFNAPSYLRMGTLHQLVGPGQDLISGQTSGPFGIAGLSGFIVGGHDLSTGDPFSFAAWCIEPFQNVGVGNYNLTALADVLANTVKQSQLNALLANAPAVVDGNTAAGIQVAIWEIVSENETSGYDVAVGDFFVDSVDFPIPADPFDPRNVDVLALANSYLTNVGDGTTGLWKADQNLWLKALQDPQRQDLLTAVAVPEPASWAMLIAGFGLVGGVMRRRAAPSSEGAVATA